MYSSETETNEIRNPPESRADISNHIGKIAVLEFSKTNSYTILHLFFQPRFKQATQKLVTTQTGYSK
jgi:hypothetical protein